MGMEQFNQSFRDDKKEFAGGKVPGSNQPNPNDTQIGNIPPGSPAGGFSIGPDGPYTTSPSPRGEEKVIFPPVSSVPQGSQHPNQPFLGGARPEGQPLAQQREETKVESGGLFREILRRLGF